MCDERNTKAFVETQQVWEHDNYVKTATETSPVHPEVPIRVGVLHRPPHQCKGDNVGVEVGLICAEVDTRRNGIKDCTNEKDAGMILLRDTNRWGWSEDKPIVEAKQVATSTTRETEQLVDTTKLNTQSKDTTRWATTNTPRANEQLGNMKRLIVQYSQGIRRGGLHREGARHVSHLLRQCSFLANARRKT